MWNSVKLLMLYVVSAIGLVGCSAGPQPMLSSVPSAQIPQTIEELAGSWEYVDTNGAFPLMLDEQGDGPYDWKEGRFETSELKDGVWKGKWYQAENDREGEFVLTFSTDAPLAKGEWWYTRIGSDTAPLEPGGRFSLKQLPGVMTTGK